MSLCNSAPSRLQYGSKPVSFSVFLFSFGHEAACKVLCIRHVRPSVRLYQHAFHWRDFLEILCWGLYEILFRISEFENCAPLDYYAAICGNSLPTFRDNISVPSSRVNKPNFMIFQKSEYFKYCRVFPRLHKKIFVASFNSWEHYNKKDKCILTDCTLHGIFQSVQIILRWSICSKTYENIFWFFCFVTFPFFAHLGAFRKIAKSDY